MTRTITHSINRWGTVALSALLAFIIACNDTAGPGPNPYPQPTVARVAISPAMQAIGVGATLDLVGTAYDAANQEITGLAVSWESDRADVATVSASGRLEAKAVGIVTITATIEGKSGSLTITVTSLTGPISRIAIEPGPLSLQEGTALTLTAVAYDAVGNVVPTTGFHWESSNDDIATVTQDGLVTALRPGSNAISVVLAQFGAVVSVDVFAEWGFDLVYDEVTNRGPELFVLDVRERVGVPHLILPEGSVGSDPTPSPDGSKIAYVVNEATSTAIYVAHRDGSNARRLTAQTGFADQPAWSPDGSQLVFRYRAVAGAPTDIWKIDADGQNAVSITADMGAGSFEREPAWSAGGPNGSRIAFIHVNMTASQIYSMRPDGVGKRRVTGLIGLPRDASPAWSPDGTKLVFIRDSKLWVVSEAGGDEHLLLGIGGSQFAPAWSPDGNLIAFASTHEAGALIYTVWSDGTRVARRTGQGDFFGNVAWRVR